MKTFIIIALLFTTPAAAQTLIIRDNDGTKLATIEEGPGNRLIIRDSEGHRIGTLEEAPGDRVIVRDNEGNRTGSLDNLLDGED